MESNNKIGKEEMDKLNIWDELGWQIENHNNPTIVKWCKENFIPKSLAQPLSPQSSVGVEEILLAKMKETFPDFDLNRMTDGYRNSIIAAMTEYSSLMNKDASIIKEELLKLANSMDAYVDFSDKTYDGDKEAPMDAVGFIHHLQQTLKEKDEKIEYWKQRCEAAEKLFVLNEYGMYITYEYNNAEKWQSLKNQKQ